MKKLHLDDLKKGLPVISPATGAFLAEAAMVCLETQGHKSGVILKVSGDFEVDFEITWNLESNELIRRTWRDLREAAEFGATAITMLVAKEITGFNYFERIPQGERADYWMDTFKGDEWMLDDKPKKAKLEISGILKKSKFNTINLRIFQKRKQASKATGIQQPTFISVVEFGAPIAKIIVTT